MIQILIILLALYSGKISAQDFESDSYCDEYFIACNSNAVGCPDKTIQCSLEITSTSDKRLLNYRILCDGQLLALGNIRRSDITSQFSKICTITEEDNKRFFDSISNRIAIQVVEV